MRSLRPGPRDRGGRSTVLRLAVACLALMAAALAVHSEGGFGSATVALERHLPRPLGWPPVASDQELHRLRPAVQEPAGTGGYSFEHTVGHDATPVRWDPCQPIHYVVNPALEPAGGRALIGSAVREVSRLTGLTFAYDGTTSETLPATGMTQRPTVQKSRYGDRWAPVLVSWATSATQHDLAGAVAGEAGPTSVGRIPGDQVYVTGSVLLDADQVLPDGPGDARALARAVVLHELGHLVGLGHVQDPSELMNPTAEVSGYRAGDRRGLAILGDGSCRPDV